MARLKPIEPDEAPPEVARLYELVRSLTGGLSNLTKTLAHSPEVMRAMIPFLVTVQREGAGSVAATRMKELAILKVSTINECVG